MTAACSEEARRGLATHAGGLDDGGRRQLTGGGAPVADGLGERAREVQHDEAKAVVHVAVAMGAWSGEDAVAASSASRPWRTRVSARSEARKSK